jgi:anti-sigma regulatory factor (Ser/Thr protein kinase)
MSPDVERLRISADVGRLAEMRALVRSAAHERGAPSDVVDDLVQAVDEAATNTIVHGYAGRPGWLEVTLASDGSDIVITLEDEAPAFDPTEQPEPDMDVPALARGPGGMGIHLMRLATDRLDYRARDGGGNVLTLTRSLDRHAEEDG